MAFGARAQCVLVGVCLGFGVSAAAGCGNPEAAQARAVVAGTILCPDGELEAGLERETPRVREWVVGCNFIYARVHCSASGCVKAEPEPPCIGDLPCFEEDPVTLEWVPKVARR